MTTPVWNRAGRDTSARSRPTAGESAGARIRRLLARFIGAGYIAYLVVTVAESGRQSAPVASWWTVAALMLAVAPGVLLLTASFRSGVAAGRWIRISAVWAVAGYVAAALIWFTAWTGDGVADSSSSTWLVRFSGLVGLCAALILRPVQAIVVQAVVTAMSSIINQSGVDSAEPLWPRIAAETLWAWGFSGVFVAATVAAVRTSYVLDATKDSVARSAAAHAAQAARARERAKFDALVHDRVIAVLLDAARTTTPSRLPAQAMSALSALDGLTAATASTGNDVVTADVIVDRLRSMTNELDSAVAVSTDTVARADWSYPAEAVDAVMDATTEAVRNSLLHAGDAAPPHVTLTANPNHILVVVIDHGRGFEPSTVDPARFGVAGSIAGRMHQIPGGRAEIVTGLGSGTSVRLHWNRPAPASATSTGGNHSAGVGLPAAAGQGILDVVGLRSRWSRTVAAVFVACAAVAALTSISAGMHPLSALTSLVLLAVGVGSVAIPGGDVLARRWTAVCMATVPLQIIAAATGLAGPVADPVGNAASISGGLVVCAFLCVRGRAGWAWLCQLIACAIYTGWVIDAGSPVSEISQIVAPSIGVMVIATVFSALLRPAAREIFLLRVAQTAQVVETAADDAANAERRRQTERLDQLARPALKRICDAAPLSQTDKHKILLLEARLRDSIRAPGLDIPALTDAVWTARDRGVTVTLLDDGALDELASKTIAQLHHSIVEHVYSAHAGTTMTIRIAPPKREYLATVTITTDSGRNSRHEYDHTATLLTNHNGRP